MKTKPSLERSKPLQTSPNRILVPVDFSSSEDKTLGYAIPLAKMMRARIVLLHVVEPSYPGPEPGLGYIPISTETQEQAAKVKLRRLAGQRIPEALFEHAVVRLGSPHHQIVEAAKDLNASLIVISSHGRTGLSHILLGSTAERVVQHAACPVLTVKTATTAAAQKMFQPVPRRRHHPAKPVLARRR